MASNDDFLNTFKNLVVSVNNFSQAQYFLAGQADYLEATGTVLIKAKAGWVAKVSVLVAGSTSGAIYDTFVASGAVTGARIAIIPNTIGVQTINIPFSNGLVFVSGTGMIATISYS
jgi:hypothetical protein